MILEGEGFGAEVWVLLVEVILGEEDARWRRKRKRKRSPWTGGACAAATARWLLS